MRTFLLAVTLVSLGLSAWAGPVPGGALISVQPGSSSEDDENGDGTRGRWAGYNTGGPVPGFADPFVEIPRIAEKMKRKEPLDSGDGMALRAAANTDLFEEAERRYGPRAVSDPAVRKKLKAIQGALALAKGVTEGSRSAEDAQWRQFIFSLQLVVPNTQRLMNELDRMAKAVNAGQAPPEPPANAPGPGNPDDGTEVVRAGPGGGPPPGEEPSGGAERDGGGAERGEERSDSDGPSSGGAGPKGGGEREMAPDRRSLDGGAGDGAIAGLTKGAKALLSTLTKDDGAAGLAPGERSPDGGHAGGSPASGDGRGGTGSSEGAGPPPSGIQLAAAGPTFAAGPGAFLAPGAAEAGAPFRAFSAGTSGAPTGSAGGLTFSRWADKPGDTQDAMEEWLAARARTPAGRHALARAGVTYSAVGGLKDANGKRLKLSSLREIIQRMREGGPKAMVTAYPNYLDPSKGGISEQRFETLKGWYRGGAFADQFSDMELDEDGRDFRWTKHSLDSRHPAAGLEGFRRGQYVAPWILERIYQWAAGEATFDEVWRPKPKPVDAARPKTRGSDWLRYVLRRVAIGFRWSSGLAAADEAMLVVSFRGGSR